MYAYIHTYTWVTDVAKKGHVAVDFHCTISLLTNSHECIGMHTHSLVCMCTRMYAYTLMRMDTQRNTRIRTFKVDIHVCTHQYTTCKQWSHTHTHHIRKFVRVFHLHIVCPFDSHNVVVLCTWLFHCVDNTHVWNHTGTNCAAAYNSAPLGANLCMCVHAVDESVDCSRYCTCTICCMPTMLHASQHRYRTTKNQSLWKSSFIVMNSINGVDKNPSTGGIGRLKIKLCESQFLPYWTILLALTRISAQILLWN